MGQPGLADSVLEFGEAGLVAAVAELLFDRRNLLLHAEDIAFELGDVVLHRPWR